MTGATAKADKAGTAIVCLVTLLALPAPSEAQRSIYSSARHGGTYMFNYYIPPAPITTQWAPAWAPDGNRIAVSMAGSIWSIDRRNGVARELTADGAYHSSPTWSPDGKWIVYTSDDNLERVNLAIVDVQTGETRSLTDGDGLYLDPEFSPDGSKLVYVANQPGGYFNVFVRPIRDGAWAGEPVAVTADNSFGRSRLYFGAWDMHTQPTWHPSGDELLLVSNRDVPLGSGNVLRVPARAMGIAEAVTVLHEQTLYRTRPDASIDGRRFIYSGTRGTADQFNNLYVQPTSPGGEPYKMTFYQHDAFHPRWSPDGEHIAFIHNRDGLPRLATIETYGGRERDIDISERQWRRPMGAVRIRVEDETGGLTGARIGVTASDGKFYAPHDAYARVRFTRDHAFHGTGESLIHVPVGDVAITVTKGFEFTPAAHTVTARPSDTTDVTIRLERVSDVSDQGWFNGSTHVHMNYAGNLGNSLENLMMMSEAEDQDIVLEEIANKDNRILDYQYFVPGGGAHPVSTPDRVVVVGQEYRPPFYGHVFMFGLRDHLISPFVTGYEGTAIESLYPSNTDMLRKAIAQGATVGYQHPWYGDDDPITYGLGGAKGFLVDAALGTTHALEWSRANRASFYPLYAVWSNGLRVAATGGEDSISDLQVYQVVGAIRTFVYTGTQRLTADAFLAGVRAGRSYVSNGPLLDFRVNGEPIGSEIALAEPGAVQVSARIRSIAPVNKAEVVFNGEVVATVPLSPDGMAGLFQSNIEIDRSGWLHLRVEGDSADVYPLDAAYAQAFTNPVWITVAGQPIRERAAAEYGLRWMESIRQQAEEWPGWRSQRERDHVFAQFDEALALYQRHLDESRN